MPTYSTRSGPAQRRRTPRRRAPRRQHRRRGGNTRRAPLRHTAKAAPAATALKTLKPHQRNITSFLTQHCPTRTGVILYHYMGTGKTFSALTVAVNWGHDIVLIAPKMLQTQWKTDYFEPYASTRPKIAAICAYEDIASLLDAHDPTTSDGKAWYARHTVIMDESHNIAHWMNNSAPVGKKGYYMKRLMAFGHRILLTGTPMYWGPRDLAFQVNIAAGSPVMPVDAVDFDRKFFRTDIFKAAVFGWLNPVHVFIQAVIAYTQGLDKRSEQLLYPFGLTSAYLMFTRNKNDPLNQGVNRALDIARPMQKAVVATERLLESAYIKAADRPMTLASRHVLKPLQQEYTQLAHKIGTSQGVVVKSALNFNSFEAFSNNAPVSAADYFVILNEMIASFKSNQELPNKLAQVTYPKKPPADATDRDVMRYHQAGVRAILSGLDPKSKAAIDAARDKLLDTLKISPPNTKEVTRALVHFRNVFSKNGGNRGKVHIDFYVQQFVGGIRRLVQTVVWQIQYLIIVGVISLVIWLSQRMYTEQKSMRYIDTSLFEKSVAPYVSYYKPVLATNTKGSTQEQRERSWTEWLARSLSLKSGRTKARDVTRRSRSRSASTRTDTAGRSRAAPASEKTFPIVHEAEVRTPYTSAQSDLFIRYTMSKMSYADYAAIQVIASPNDNPELESFDQTSSENYEKYGTYIGNICTFVTDSAASQKLSPPLHIHDRRHLHYNATRNIWELRRGSRFDVVSPKFEEIVRRIKIHGGRQVLFSNYTIAGQALCAHLVQAFNVDGRDCVRFVSNDATDAVKDILLNQVSKPGKPLGWYYAGDRPSKTAPKLLILDSKYTEGLSVLSTDVMHILDPCQSLAMEEQLKARVARLNSHTKGDSLHLYEYMAYSPLLQNGMASVGRWITHGFTHNFFSMPTTFAQSITPDYVIKTRIKNMDKLTKSLAYKLRDTSVERYMPDEATSRRDGVATAWTKPMPSDCGEPIDCLLSTPGIVSEWKDPRACALEHRRRTRRAGATSAPPSKNP